MNKAKILEHRTEYVFGCPDCDYSVYYDATSAPKDFPTYHVCEKCVEPFMIGIVESKARFKPTPKGMPKMKRAKDQYKKPQTIFDIAAKSLRDSYDFSRKEVDEAIALGLKNGALTKYDDDMAEIMTAILTLLAKE